MSSEPFLRDAAHLLKNKLSDRMIKQLLLNSVNAKYRVSQINYLPQPSALANNVLLTTDKSKYFAQPRPIIVNYFILHNPLINTSIRCTCALLMKAV